MPLLNRQHHDHPQKNCTCLGKEFFLFMKIAFSFAESFERQLPNQINENWDNVEEKYIIYLRINFSFSLVESVATHFELIV